MEEELPIFECRGELLQAIRDYQVLVIVGDACSGTTTHIPQYLYEDGYTHDNGKLIGCTQPSSFAAKTVAAHVSKMQIIDDHIRFMTESMLLHEFLAHPNLIDNYSVIIFDQAHQNTLSTAVLLPLLKVTARARPDLKLLIVVSSFYMTKQDAENLSTFFDYAPIFGMPRGKRYPVKIHYYSNDKVMVDYLEVAIDTALHIHVTQPLPGDILLFLPSQEETQSAKQQILSRHDNKTKELVIYSTACEIEYQYDSKVFQQQPATATATATPQRARKIFLATNNAEASVISSISNIKYVIDSGLCQRKVFDPVTETESLVVVHISKASAYQRAALCEHTGGLDDGRCFRLYTSYHHSQQMEDVTLPEIQHRNLANMVLILKSLGIHDLLSFDLLDRPPTESLNKAVDLLYRLGALDRLGQLTQVGRKMADLFPLDDPMLSKMIVASDHHYNYCSHANFY